MFKKKFFSFGVMIVLIIACVVLIFTLFIVSSVPAVNNPGPSAGASSGGSGPASEDEYVPSPGVVEWEMPIVVSITGVNSDTGLAAAWGFDYGIKTVNEMGGIRGLPVRITVRDTASSTAEVTSEVEMLTPDSLVIMGPPTETDFKAGEQVFYNAGLPAVGAAIDQKNRNAFQPFAISCITDPGVTAESVIATWVRVERFTKVCIIYTSATRDRIEHIEAALDFMGKEPEAIEVGGEAYDAATIAENAFATGADAFYIDLTGEDTLRMITQIKFLAGDAASTLKILCGPMAADKELLESDTEGELYGVRVWTTIDPGKDIEKRKAFNESFDKNVGDLYFRSLALDYYQSAIMLKQGIETLELTNEHGDVMSERLSLANWLFNSDLVHTEHGDFLNVGGGKIVEAKLFRITEKGFV